MIAKLLLATTSLTFIGSAVVANADEDPATAIERCAKQSDEASRIACLEAALRGEAPEAQTNVAPAPQPAVEAPVEMIVAEPAPQPVEKAPVEMIVAEPAPTAPNPVQPVDDLGAEQVEARAATKMARQVNTERQTFSVATTRTVPYEKLEITLANGQVWRQIKGDSQKIRIPRKYKDGLTAEVWRGPVSGYKMRLSELKRTIRVERLK